MNATTPAIDCSVTGKKQAVICLPTAEEYQQLLNDPDTEWCFDEDGFPIGGVMRVRRSEIRDVNNVFSIAKQIRVVTAARQFDTFHKQPGKKQK